MQDSDLSQATEPDIPEHLRALADQQGPESADQGPESLTDLAYRRAREALENALEESRKIRLQALDDARRISHEEIEALRLELERQRQAAEAETATLKRRAELDAERIRAEAQRDALEITRAAKAEAQETLGDAAQTLVEARTLRIGADERQREVERLEAEFNQVASELGKRMGMVEEPDGGWWRRIMRRRRKG